MKYVSHVKSSIKGGCDVQLSPRTVIVGPNGSGKTTIVQGIELGTSGYVTDMEGRDQVKQGKALSRLFPEGCDMFAKVTVSDTADDSVSHVLDWSMEAGPRGGFKTPEHEPPFRVRFPVQELINTLKGDANTVGAWLEGQVLDSMTKEDLLSALPPVVRDDADSFITRQRKTDFLALAKTAAQEAKNLKSQATRTEKTIDKMTEGVAPPLTVNKRAELEAEWDALNTKLQAASGVSMGVFEAKSRQLAEAKAELDGIVLRIAELPELPENVQSALLKVDNAKRLIRDHVDYFGADSCWVCGNDEGEGILGQVEQLNAVESTYADQVDAHRLRNQATALARTTAGRIKALQAEIEAMEVADDDTDREGIQLKMRAVMDKLSMDKAARQTWANADATRREVSAMRAQAERLSLVGKELKTAGQRLLDERKAAFETQVSSFLPEGESLGVDLASSRLGLVRSGQLHSALSGAEESRVLLALASAQEDGSTPCVLIPKDRGWDRDTLGHVMAALSASPVQVVIMSTVEPDPVEGWTLVNLE